MRYHRDPLRACLLALAAAAVIAAPGATAKDGRESSFAGSCSLQGPVTFSPPLTSTEGSLTYDYRARGTCSGALNGHHVADAPVVLRHSGPAEGSCSQAHTTAPGHGTLRFTRSTGAGDDVTIPYTLEFTDVLTEVDFTLKGQKSGTAKAHGSFLTTRTPPDAAAKCAGEGNAELPMDMSLTTDTPLTAR